MLTTTAALIVFLFPLAYSPGPGNMFFAANGARFGGRATIPATTGYHVATWIVTAAIGLVFGAAVATMPRAFGMLKIAGALYVMWIAWKMLRAGVSNDAGAAGPPTFANGVVLLVLNPKAFVIIALMFTQFLGPADDRTMSAVLWITTVFTLNNLIAFAAWTALGDTLAGLFRSPQSARLLNMAMGGLLALVGVWMLLS